MQRLMRYLNIRPNETHKVLWSGLFGFLIGFFQNYINAIPLAIFLHQFSSQYLPQIYIGASVALFLSGVILTYFEYRHSFTRLIFGVFCAIASITMLVWYFLENFNHAWIIFALLIWGLTAYELTFNLFWSVLNRIYTLEQGKRLFGVVGSIKCTGAIVAGALMPVFLAFFTMQYMIMITGFICLTTAIIAFYLLYSSSPATEDDELIPEQPVQLKEMKKPLAWKLCVLAMLGISGFYVIDMLFNTAAEARFSDEKVLASFLGSFLALINIANLFIGSFLFAHVIKRYGLIVTTYLLPVATLILTLALCLVASIPWTFGLIFWLVCGLKLVEDSIRATISEVSYILLLQPLTPNFRAFVLTKLDLIAIPIATLLISIILMIVNHFYGVHPLPFALIIIIIYILYAVDVFSIKSDYLLALKDAIANRYFVNTNDRPTTPKESLNIVQQSLLSPFPSEVIYALSLLEKNGGNVFYDGINIALGSQEQVVRRFAISKIKYYQLRRFYPTLLTMVENDPELAGDALIAVATFGQEHHFIEQVEHWLDSDSLDKQITALTIALKLLRMNEDIKLLAQTKLENMLGSPDKNLRAAAAYILGEINQEWGNIYLKQLIKDSSKKIRQEAYYAIIKTKNTELFPQLIKQLHKITLPEEILNQLLLLKDKLVPLIIHLFPTLPLRLQEELLILLSQMETLQTPEFLEKIAMDNNFNLQLHATESLMSMNKQPSKEFLQQLNQGITEEVSRLKEQYQQLNYVPDIKETQLLRDVIQRRINLFIDKILLSLGLIYNKALFLRARLGIELGKTEETSYAIELIIQACGKEHQRIVGDIFNRIYFSGQLATTAINSPEFLSVLKNNLKYSRSTPLASLGALAAILVLKEIPSLDCENELQGLQGSKSKAIAEALEWLHQSLNNN